MERVFKCKMDGVTYNNVRTPKQFVSGFHTAVGNTPRCCDELAGNECYEELV